MRHARVSGLFLALSAVLVAAGPFAAAAQHRTGEPPEFDSIEWSLPAAHGRTMRAVAHLPHGRGPQDRFPLLVLFHGSTESALPQRTAAWSWLDNYWLGTSTAALRQAVLPRSAFLWRVTPERQRALQQTLRSEPYHGLVVVTPYTPDFFVGGQYDDLPAYIEFVATTLVARARAELPVLTSRESTGVDGVSMGGFVALMVGLSRPETFGVVGALLPAVRTSGPAVLAAAGASPAPSRRPAQTVRLVTSDRDYLRNDIRRLSSRMRQRGIAHELVELVGGHDYEFSRGTGGLEMLLFHDRTQRGEPAP